MLHGCFQEEQMSAITTIMKETARVAFRGSGASILLSLSVGAALKVEFHQAYGRSREGVIRFTPDSKA